MLAKNYRYVINVIKTLRNMVALVFYYRFNGVTCQKIAFVAGADTAISVQQKPKKEIYTDVAAFRSPLIPWSMKLALKRKRCFRHETHLIRW